jgi:hypothetical protein
MSEHQKKSTRINTNIPIEVYKIVKMQAGYEMVTIQDFIEKALKYYLEHKLEVSFMFDGCYIADKVEIPKTMDKYQEYIFSLPDNTKKCLIDQITKEHLVDLKIRLMEVRHGKTIKRNEL